MLEEGSSGGFSDGAVEGPAASMLLERRVREYPMAEGRITGTGQGQRPDRESATGNGSSGAGQAQARAACQCHGGSLRV